jgi:hypothetical protein
MPRITNPNLKFKDKANLGGLRTNSGPKPKDMLLWLRERCQMDGKAAWIKVVELSEGKHDATPEIQYRALCTILYYSFGKPKETMQVNVTTRHILDALQGPTGALDDLLDAPKHVDNIAGQAQEGKGKRPARQLPPA